MKRRNFLQASGAVSIPLLLNGFRLSAADSGVLGKLINPESDKVLVVVQLNGGNDGLNTIIPLDRYDTLAGLRASILLPQSSLIPISNTTALHPSMVGMERLFKDGRMNVVQSAGYPNQNRSHFRSMDIWQSGSSAENEVSSGWIGRYFDQLYPNFPEGYPNTQTPHPIAIRLGSTVTETCQGIAANYSLAIRDPFSIRPLLEGEDTAVPDTYYGDELEFLRTSIAQTNAYAEVVTDAAENGNTLAKYPENNRLANKLRNVAQLISGGLQTKIYVVSIGGFDTHANQIDRNDPTNGRHAELLSELSGAIAAFQADLVALGIDKRVVGMTFSEFGRQIRANDSFGTDHGTAAPLILFGSCVNGGFIGDSPEIGNDIRRNEGVPMQHDFRDIYGSVLMDWFDVPEIGVRTLLYDGFTYLPIIGDCSGTVTSNNNFEQFNFDATVFPNPFRGTANIQFETQGEWVRLSVFDALGAEVETIMSQKLPQGEHTVRINMSRYASGPYFFRLQRGDQFITKRAVKY